MTDGVTEPRVQVLVRARCPTCDRMEAAVSAVCDELGVAWRRVDVDDAATDPELRHEYGDVVPVTLVDGREHASWSVDRSALRVALAG